MGGGWWGLGVGGWRMADGGWPGRERTPACRGQVGVDTWLCRTKLYGSLKNEAEYSPYPEGRLRQ